MFPRSEFTPAKLRKQGVGEDQIHMFLERVDRLGNLQLLEDIPNMEKQNSNFSRWVDATFTTDEEKYAYMARHYIPNVSFKFNDFLKFFEQRENKLRDAFKSILIQK